jgi:hypothetical protein
MLQSAAELTFDAGTHVYRYGGRVVPSVTQVLSILSANEFTFVDAERLAAARQLGTHVHAAIDLDNRGELDEAQLDPELKPYVTQWRKFLRTTGWIVTTSEQRVYHPTLGYAGQADTGIWQNGHWVLDIKTGMVPRTVGPQTAAYQHAMKPKPKRRLCLQLKADSYQLRECKNPADFSIFTSCLNIWRFINAA